MTRSRDLANLADGVEFTAADNTKLDGIETSATADQTDAQIKTAVEAGADIALAGNPTTTTQSAGNNTTRVATTAFTQAAITALVDSSPASLNTLNELAAALGDDANFSTTVTNSIATKLPLAGGTLTGDLTTAADSSITIQGTHNEGGGLLDLKGTDTPASGKNLGQVSFGNSTDPRLAMIRGVSSAADAADLGFFTEATGASIERRMTILSTGKVGIGVSDPDSTLDISGGSNKLGILRVTQRASGASAYGLDVGLDPSTGDPVFSRIVNDTVTEAFRIQRSSGNVGIGITAPAQLLHVQAGSTGNGVIRVGGGAGLEISHDNSGATTQRIDSLYRTTNNSANLQIRTGTLTFHMGTSSTERMRIDSNGRVGIGTNSPAAPLHIKTGTNENFRMSSDSSVRIQAMNDAGDTINTMKIGGSPLIFLGSGGTERMRIDSSGNVGIGISTINNTYSSSHALQIASVSDNNWGGTLILSSANGSSVFSRLVASTSGLDIINQIASPLRFFTTNTERMRIDSGGDVKVNHTGTLMTALNPAQFQIKASNLKNGCKVEVSNTNYVAYGSGTSVANNYYFGFMANSSNVQIGSIYCTTSGVAYNTSSDYRLKENVDYTWDATTRLKQLKPARFNFIANADTTVDGFLAHEAATVVPEAVTGTKDEVDDDGVAVMQGIDQAKLVPLLVKTIQELEARITALEA